MKIKKLLAALMAITLIGGAANAPSQAAQSRTLTASAADYTQGLYKELSYNAYSDHIIITNCTREATGEITIPDEIEGLPVTVVGPHAFMGCQKITSVIMPDSVTAIGYGAFSDCSSLRSIEIPDSVTTIDEWAFANCISLEVIKLSDSLEGIRFRTFLSCTNLQNITLPDSITKIEEDAFADCKSLISITIPANVKSIEDKAFAFCTNLESITILNPDCIIRDEGNGKTICTDYVSDDSDDVYFDGIIFGYANSGAQAYAEKYGYAFEAIEDYTEGTYENLTYKKYADRIEIVFCDREAESVVIPDEIEGLPVTRIDHFAFINRNLLKSVTIPDSVTSIGTAAFASTGLTEITIPDSVTELGDIAFSECSQLTSAKLPDNLTEIATGLFQNCQKLGAITIPDSVTSIGANAFWNCTSLISVTVPESVTTIRNFAFNECESLESITILNPDCEIQNSGLSNDDIGYTICNKYDKNDEGEYYTIFDGTIYGYDDSTAQAYAEKFGYKFENISGAGEFTEGTYERLTYRKYKDHIEIIDCVKSNPADIVVPDEIEGLPVTSIGDGAFNRCVVYHITIPDSVEYIGEEAFFECTNLVDFKIPDGVKSIKDRTFGYCHSLEAIAIPDSVTSIGDEAFYWCSSFTELTVPGSVESIGDLAFAKCSELEKLTISDGVKTIGKKAFEECERLIEAAIADSVTSIGEGAFTSCRRLESVKLSSGIETIPEKMFLRCAKLKSVTIPDSVTSIEGYAFYDCYALSSITIPESVESIGENAFFNCEVLDSVTILNPDCSIFPMNDTFCNSYINGNDFEIVFEGTIYGYEGSTAQAYAEKFGYKFESLGEAPDDNGEYTPGDANMDGVVDLADAVLIMQCIANPNRFGVNGSEPSHITEQGYKNADCSNNDGVTNGDALAIQKYLLGILDSLPE